MKNKINNIAKLEAKTWNDGNPMIPKKTFSLYDGKETFVIVISNIPYPAATLGGKTRVGYTTIHWDTGIACGDIHTTIKSAYDHDPARIMEVLPTHEAFKARVETKLEEAKKEMAPKEVKKEEPENNPRKTMNNNININSTVHYLLDGTTIYALHHGELKAKAFETFNDAVKFLHQASAKYKVKSYVLRRLTPAEIKVVQQTTQVFLQVINKDKAIGVSGAIVKAMNPVEVHAE